MSLLGIHPGTKATPTNQADYSLCDEQDRGDESTGRHEKTQSNGIAATTSEKIKGDIDKKRQPSNQKNEPSGLGER